MNSAGVSARVVEPSAPSGPSTRTLAEVRIKVRPDQFGLDITSTQPIREGTITFKYARHFEAPAPAVERYGRDGAFESRLAVGRLKADGTIELLPTRRPASDNVSAPLAGAGSYVVAAPR